jgi:ubiquinone/menaquinone biosynthesis C-methylase UbiE
MFQNTLELGAGDGGQSLAIAKYTNHLTCTEINKSRLIMRDLPNVHYELCDATDLSRFSDESFDFVYSSNMLEHIPDWKQCLSECRRVLTAKGLMVHSMPSRTWKFWNTVISMLIKKSKPAIHGVEHSHFAEFIAFGESRWIKKIESSNLRVESILRLPFYFGHGPTALPLIKLGNRLGWASSSAFLIRKS